MGSNMTKYQVSQLADSSGEYMIRSHWAPLKPVPRATYTCDQYPLFESEFQGCILTKKHVYSKPHLLTELEFKGSFASLM